MYTEPAAMNVKTLNLVHHQYYSAQDISILT